MGGTLLLSLSILLLSLLLPAESATYTQVYGNIDNFATNDGIEWLPMAPSLGVCTSEFYWRDIPYAFNVNGDSSVMTEPHFDEKGTNSPIVWTVSNLPTDKPLTNVKIEMRIYGKDTSNNDGFGFLWDDNIQSSKPSCKAQYWRRFTTISSTWADWRTEIIVWNVPTNELISSTKTLLQRIQETGYFHIIVGDDTSVDYMKITYDYDGVPANIVAFTCKSYTNTGSVVTSTKVYTDDTTSSITAITDPGLIPFRGSSLISTVLSDKSQSESIFKVEIKSATRFFVFVQSGYTLSWLTNGGWDVVSGATVSVTKGTTVYTFNVYTKKYDNPRWVVFGSPSGPALTYFVSYTSAPSIAPVVSNTAARCDCSSTGDPHYVTWDNRRYDLYEPGVFHLVKSRDCTFDVQTLTFKYGSSVTVNGIISVRYLNNIVTLARNPGAAGAAWTDNPTVRMNGVNITSSTSVGGLVATYSSGQWDISIPDVGLVVKTVVSGTWFHVYPSLSSPDYQRKVDGLCGNCDGNPANDFKYPSCTNAIADTSSKLTCNDVAQWGVSWKAGINEQVANTSILTTTNRGTTAYAACLAAPLIQQCSDLVVPEPPKVVGTTTQNVTEPSPPASFATCSGTTIVPPVIPPAPTPPPTIPTPLLCTDSPNYAAIKARCNFCAATAGTPCDDCILDLCVTGQTPSTFQCPGVSNCVNQTDTTRNITVTVSGISYVYATLGGGSVTADPTSQYCQPSSFRLPPGWDIAPNNDASKTVISTYSWESACLVLSDGSSYATDWGLGKTTCPRAGTLVKSSDGCYTANQCNLRILIRKSPPVCGNGVVEGTEQCDDKNTANGDGCSSTCRFESTTDWTCDTKVSPTICYPVSNIVSEPEYHTCPINLTSCKGCLVTTANSLNAYCCECAPACCA